MPTATRNIALAKFDVDTHTLRYHDHTISDPDAPIMWVSIQVRSNELRIRTHLERLEHVIARRGREDGMPRIVVAASVARRSLVAECIEREKRRRTLLDVPDSMIMRVLQSFVVSKCATGQAITARQYDVDRVRVSLLSDEALGDVLQTIMGSSSGSGAEPGLEIKRKRVDEFIGHLHCAATGSHRLGGAEASAQRSGSESCNQGLSAGSNENDVEKASTSWSQHKQTHEPVYMTSPMLRVSKKKRAIHRQV